MSTIKSFAREQIPFYRRLMPLPLIVNLSLRTRGGQLWGPAGRMRRTREGKWRRSCTLNVVEISEVGPVCFTISSIMLFNSDILSFPAGKMKLEFLENPSSTLLGYSRISNLIQAHFWDFLEIACWYWPDLAIIQVTKLGLGRISLNLRQKCEFQENSNFSNFLKIQAQC